ncbi:MAG: aminotransferase class III-fold pyridoxal phosphate-dependent enzyme [Candidatus Wallbacteria bacterium]|nr:aminotransferase class III-fold pyridoxal phosphate-dependent enzyme [Candidatus Wallbacteria bacterium]
MGFIRLKTEIPGPRSREILARRAAAVCSGLGKATQVVLASGRGALVEDVDGNTLIDLAGGIGMLAAGHSPPEVVDAIHAAARQMIHPSALVVTFESFVRVCEVLNEIAPGNFPKKSLLANTGAEAVENAIKLARAYTGRPAVICFQGAYHGRTPLTMTLTSKYGLFKKSFGPFAPEVYRLPAPNVYRTPEGMTPDQHVSWCCQNLENALVSHVDPSALAAIIFEPVQGEAGFIPLPHAFVAKIREICDRHQIVMIADEVQSGFGRTGRLFAIEHYEGIVPDLMVTAKSIASGMPISAVTGKAEIVDATHLGGVGGTYGGAPVTCAAALATIELIRKPGFLEHARRLGEVMRETMEGWKSDCSLVGDVRGLGPMMLVELVLDRQKKTPAMQQTVDVIAKTSAGGVLAMRAGLYSNCVRLLPPLVITEEQLREALGVLERAIRRTGEQIRAS